MPDPNHCPTCYALATSTVEVTAEQLGEERRRFVPNVGTGLDQQHFDSAGAVRSHPLARAMWVTGVAAIELGPDAVVVDKKPAASWVHLEPLLARILAERIALSQTDRTV